MRRRDKVRILRKAANLIEKSLDRNYGFNKRTQYSCHAIKIVSGQRVHEENELSRQYSCSMSPVPYNVLTASDFEGLEGLSEQTQLHRSLLLDLYAEILENGDEV